MALTLPLYQRSGSLLFLDDDVAFLDMLAVVLPGALQVELYSRPADFLERMREEPARWEADAGAQLHLIDRWRKGQALVPQLLRYWATSTARYRLAQVCAVDHLMPGTNGLTVLNTLLDWPGSRILLTGQADNEVAIQAFNDGLIDQYIQKQAPHLATRIETALNRLVRAPHPRLNAIWRVTLQPIQLSLLQLPSVARALQAWTLNRWVEYVIVGEPFGVLGLNAAGQVGWLQLEPCAGLSELAELTESAGLPADMAARVAAGRCLPAVEIHQQLGLRGPVRVAKAFDLGGEGQLKAALFPLQAEDLPQAIFPYQNFLEAADHRRLHDGRA